MSYCDTEFLVKVISILDRRNRLYRNHPNCPKCGTDQVQFLMDINPPAEWRCRHCKYEWTFEPREASHD